MTASGQPAATLDPKHGGAAIASFAVGPGNVTILRANCTKLAAHGWSDAHPKRRAQSLHLAGRCG